MIRYVRLLPNLPVFGKAPHPIISRLLGWDLAISSHAGCPRASVSLPPKFLFTPKIASHAQHNFPFRAEYFKIEVWDKSR